MVHRHPPSVDEIEKTIMTRDPLQELLHSEVALMLVEEVPRPELVLQQQLGTRPKNLSPHRLCQPKRTSSGDGDRKIRKLEQTT